MSQTYTQRYDSGSRSAAMNELIEARGEDPIFVGASDEGELYSFPDNTEVILTNAGLSAEDEDGFSDARAKIVESTGSNSNGRL